MHCDDKRTLHVLKEAIEETWRKLQDSDFRDRELLDRLNAEIGDYLECGGPPQDR